MIVRLNFGYGRVPDDQIHEVGQAHVWLKSWVVFVPILLLVVYLAWKAGSNWPLLDRVADWILGIQ
jgi:hypothetical protein